MMVPDKWSSIYDELMIVDHISGNIFHSFEAALNFFRCPGPCSDCPVDKVAHGNCSDMDWWDSHPEEMKECIRLMGYKLVENQYDLCSGCAWKATDRHQYPCAGCFRRNNFSSATDEYTPRLPGLLRVKPGQKWHVEYPEENINSDDVWLDEKGNLKGAQGLTGTEILCTAINHPESIVRSPVLSKKEKEICRSVGAHWVSYDRGSGMGLVCLSADKPIMGKDGCYSCDSPITTIRDTLFPSVKPGDCIFCE